MAMARPEAKRSEDCRKQFYCAEKILVFEALFPYGIRKRIAANPELYFLF